MATLRDDEFGEIVIRKNPRSRHIRISLAPDGRLRASIPTHTTLRNLEKMVASSRADIRSMMVSQSPPTHYTDGMRIGKSHSLITQSGRTLSVRRQQLKLHVTLPDDASINSRVVQEKIRTEVQKILRKEASHYLTRRLRILADKLDCKYERVRFSHASTRWGSCSTSGTISLNIALMNLPFELIDYVIIHELCHTIQMNHSSAFWQLVASADPNYAVHRKTLKRYSPSI